MIEYLKKYKTVILSGLTVFSVGFALYTYFKPLKSAPKLTYYQKEVIDAFKENKQLSKLKILYDGKDIKKDSLNLKLYRLKLVNDGDVHIGEDLYSPKKYFGIKVENGIVLSFNFAGKSSDFLRENLNPEIIDSATIHFDKINIDQDNHSSFEILVMHKKDLEPKLVALGKIIGLDK